MFDWQPIEKLNAITDPAVLKKLGWIVFGREWPDKNMNVCIARWDGDWLDGDGAVYNVKWYTHFKVVHRISG